MINSSPVNKKCKTCEFLTGLLHEKFLNNSPCLLPLGIDTTASVTVAHTMTLAIVWPTKIEVSCGSIKSYGEVWI